MADELSAAIGSIDAAVTVCDSTLDILYMNEKSRATFARPGTSSLVGSSLAACHKPESVRKIEEILSSSCPNVYTIRKNGVKKLIWQGPWTAEDGSSGLVEISIPIPDVMPHFDRD